MLISILSCHSAKKDQADDYFSSIIEEVFNKRKKEDDISAIKNRELAKYKKTHDRKYLIATRYVELYEHKDGLTVEQIPSIYDFLIFNNNEYELVTMRLNFILAELFSKYSPQLSTDFANKAIKIS